MSKLPHKFQDQRVAGLGELAHPVVPALGGSNVVRGMEPRRQRAPDPLSVRGRTAVWPGDPWIGGPGNHLLEDWRYGANLVAAKPVAKGAWPNDDGDKKNGGCDGTPWVQWAHRSNRGIVKGAR